MHGSCNGDVNENYELAFGDFMHNAGASDL